MRGRVVAAALVAWAGLSPGQTAAQTADLPEDRVLVMPFENVRRDASIFWLGEGSAVLLADELNGRGVGAITRDERQRAFDRLQAPPAAALTDATVIRIGQIVGASHVIVGSLQMDGGSLVVRARRIALAAGRLQADVTDRGPLPELFALFDRLAERMRPAGRGPARAAADRPPVAAFEHYIKGILAETPATAITYLDRAIALHPGYDRARLALWEVHAARADHQRALASVQSVPPASPVARQARFLAGLSQLDLQRYDESFATFKALADEQPAPAVLNNLGVIQLRRGSTPPSAVPAFYFTGAAEADRDDPDYAFNLGYAYWQAHDIQAAVSWLREAVRRSPADGDAHFLLGTALAASGNPAESAREKELARRLSSLYEQWEKRPAADGVPKGLERVKSDLEVRSARRIEARIAALSQRDQEDLATFYVDRARRLFMQESDREAAAELERALYLSPYRADAHLLLGRIHGRNGRVREAIDAFKISLWSKETAGAHAALGEAYRQSGDGAGARAEAERALALDPSSAEARRLLDMLKSP